MKRIIAILLVAVFAAMLLTACGSDPIYNNGSSTANEAATEATVSVDINKYNKDFDGLQKYLQDLKLIDSAEDKRTELYAEVLGAEKGVRYTLNSSAFIELYAYGTDRNEIAQKVFEEVKKDGTFEFASLDPLTGVISESGNFLAVYNAKIGYDYDKILTEFKKF